KAIQKFKSADVLKIAIDSLQVTQGNLWKVKRLCIYSTFYNLSDFPLYIIANMKYFSMTNAVLYDSSGKKIYDNAIALDFIPDEIPDSTNFFKIEPHSFLKYPPEFMSVDYSSEKRYSIKILYSNKKRNKLPVVFNDKLNYKNAVYYFNMALRGDYASSNFLLYDNYKISQVK
ncbi:MAG: hypothetical protein P4L45_14345, partial [Ignavibacteriaceae bacterium]|nr:hypothetical protein [Ignavibacteriaceae bacterium]